MKYFKLGQDSRIPHGVMLNGVNTIIGYYESKKGNMVALENNIVSMVNSSKFNFYPDILDKQIYMIKGAVKEVFDMFLPDMPHKHCCLLDRPLDLYEVYYIPILDVLESIDGADGRHIFRLCGNGRDIDVFVSLEVIEALLRRNPSGIRVTAV